MTLAPNFRCGVGVDSEPVMIQTAEENARAKSILNLSFEVMTAQDLTFPTARFDVVLNRHGPVFPNEIVPVLRSGGVFITHQVGGRNFQSIFDAFDFGFRSNGDYWQDYWKRHSIEAQDQSSLIASFEALGCRIVARGEYDVSYYFTNVESLMFFLQAIPLPEDFDIDRHWKRVQNAHRNARNLARDPHERASRTFGDRKASRRSRLACSFTGLANPFDAS
jgi:hypothetical protein